ncbi:MAG TPA: hypothetical protein VK518_15150 [Puia sp.]|nr:hypothetical protein [Puia sp.]
MIRKMTALSLAGLVTFGACKKSDNPAPTPTVTVIPDSVSIIGKWLPIRISTYLYAPTGGLVDSSSKEQIDKDYYDFEKGGIVYFHEDDKYDSYPFTDTSSYKFSGTKYIILDGTDTASYRLTTNTKDTLTLTTITYNTTDYGPLVNAYDTIVMVK